MQVMAVNEVNSDRKRQSSLVKFDDKCCLLVQGADSTMVPLLRAGELDMSVPIDNFASEGLRTLVIAMKDLTSDSERVDGWLKRYEEAGRALENRDGQLAALADEIEWDLEILGVTAIEDKLQDEVGDTITPSARGGCTSGC